MKNKICRYYLKGTCTKGNLCNFQHKNPQTMHNPNYNPTHFKGDKKDFTCKYFLQGNCTKTNCSFFHGYGNKLLSLISYPNVHEMPIISFSQINENKFISCDESCFKIWGFTPNFEKLQEEKIKEGKIHKLIYSNGRVFIINLISKMYVNYSKIINAIIKNN